MGRKLGNFFTNIKHAPNEHISYISFITASLYWCTGSPWVIRRYGPNQKKNLRNINFELLTHRICSVLPLVTQGFIVTSIYWRGDAHYLNRRTHRDIRCMIRRYWPTFGASSLFVKKSPSYWPMQTGKGNMWFKLKSQVQISYRGMLGAFMWTERTIIRT